MKTVFFHNLEISMYPFKIEIFGFSFLNLIYLLQIFLYYYQFYNVII